MSICTCTPKQKASGKWGKYCDAHMGFTQRPPRKKRQKAHLPVSLPESALSKTAKLLLAATIILKRPHLLPFFETCALEDFKRADLVIGEWENGYFCILKNNHGHIHSGFLEWTDIQKFIAAQPSGALFMLTREKP